MELFMYKTVDWAYKTAKQFLPETFQNTDMFNTFMFGFGGSYGIVYGLQKISQSKIVDKLIPNFDEKWLPKLEKICIAGTALSILGFMYLNDNTAREMLANNPVYTSGMLGVALGSITRAVQDLTKRSKNNYNKHNNKKETNSFDNTLDSIL